MDQNSNKTTPGGIILWYITTILTLLCISPIMFSSLTDPVGLTLIPISIYLILCCIYVATRKYRQFIGIGHLISGVALAILSMVSYFSMENCKNVPGCVSGGGLAIAFLLVFIVPPAIFNILFGLYFTLSNKVKAYFGK